MNSLRRRCIINKRPINTHMAPALYEAGDTAQSSGGYKVSEENNRAIVRRYFEEVWNKGNLAAADLLVAPNFSLEGCGAISGLEAVKLYISSYRALYPKVHFTILSLVAEGDTVVACWVVSGMQT